MAKALSEYSEMKLWTTKELAAHTEMSEATIKRLIESGKLPSVECPGGSRRVPHFQLLKWLSGQAELGQIGLNDVAGSSDSTSER
jgi:excisionase family DNA binding protein